MLTGIHDDSFRNMQLGPGMFLRDLDPDAATDAQELRLLLADAMRNHRGLIGATQDGGQFQCIPKLRTLGVDGLRGPTRGSVVIDGWTITLAGTMTEITPENIVMAAVAAEVKRNGCRTTVRLRTQLADSDYFGRLCWVGNTPRGLMLIELTDVLNVTGLTFNFGNEREGSIRFQMQAHYARPGAQQEAPCRIIFFEEGQDS